MEDVLEYLALKVSDLTARTLHVWVKQKHSWKVYIIYTHVHQGKKRWIHRNLHQTYLLVLEGYLVELGEVIVSHCRNKDMGSKGYSILGAVLEATIFMLRRGPIQQPQSSNLTGKTTKKVHSWHHPSADRLLKAILSPELPVNTHLDIALLTRKARHNPTHH